ncbi:ATP-binding cassette domain-containing protein [Hahella sp. KA22]|uniref:ATP-binding cassette domain-containing protein n=1 Tax=Hahella sp. KA22 TaxID=1628392 RepID=UPI000FDE84B6|nr:ATP-binding cassette domain-containing protein [Hahella sp. KA22]AZZ91341.1 ATP-binding cassette domain-containing protein [Hahella sp. KA22]QAY54711.1 ATP-binding cassette domain-containing protein [Hahella sp. KA22]
MALLRLKDVSLAFGMAPLLDHADLVIESQERLCLVGRNGAGKSTLLKVCAGEIKPDGGEINRGRDLKMAYLPQELPERGDASVRSVVAEGLAEVGEWLAAYDALTQQGAEGNVAELERLHNKIETHDGWRLRQKVEAVMQRLELPGDKSISELSGGWRRRVFLARALVQEPNLLMLDEPTNHLDIDMITWLEEELLQFGGSVLFISHDRAFIDRLATRVIELDRGKLSSWPAPYEAYLAKKEEQLAAEEKEWERFDKKLADEEVWIRQGIKARRTRNEGRVRALKKLREERGQRRDRVGQVSLKVDSEERSGNLVAELKNVSFGYADQPNLVKDLSWQLMRKDRVGLLGPNGCGKSTFIKLILGGLEATEGVIKRGSRLQVAYFDQLRGQIDPEASVWDNVAKGKDFIEVGGRNVHVTGYLKDFLFSPERLRTPAKALSGGEINRLLLAKLFTMPANFLVLDEPTNDLDMDTLDLLENLLAEFDGTILLVSHDRFFIDNVVTSTLVFEGEGKISEYPGGYNDWLAQRPVVKAEAKPAEPKAQAAKPKTASDGGKAAKLSYKLQRELDALPKEIERLEAEVAAMQEEVSAADFYSRPHEDVNRALTSLAALEQTLEKTMERWMELEEMAGGG